MPEKGLLTTDLPGRKPIARGKVRDIYEVGKDQLLMVATDRISAFDVVMNEPIPGKGKILTALSGFWFSRTRDIVDNHFLSLEAADLPREFEPWKEVLAGRSMLVRRAAPLPVECVVRGYLSGSGWRDYLSQGVVSGIALPPGLAESARLDQPIFTPSSKAPAGQHDEAITFARVVKLVGEELAEKLKDTSIALYRLARDYALSRGIIIADCKFEFGLIEGKLTLIDELLTPDSSRFWPLAGYQEGKSQNSFDKQFLRDYLMTLNWDHKPPPPSLPEAIIEKTRQRYEEAFKLLTS